MSSYQFYIFVKCDPIIYLYLEEHPWFMPCALVLLGLFCIFFLKGIILNPLTYYILSKDDSDSTMNLYLKFVLALDEVNLTCNGIDALCHYMDLVRNKRNFWNTSLGQVHSINWIFRAGFVGARNWSMMVLTINRAFAVGYPMKSYNYVTTKRVFIILTILSVLVFLPNTPRFLETNLQIASCNNVTYSGIVNTGLLPFAYTFFITLFLNSLIPVFGMVGANIFTIRSLILSRKARKALKMVSIYSTTKRDVGNSKITKTVLLLSLLFVLCQIPMLIYAYINSIKGDPYIYIMFNYLALVVSNIDQSSNFWIIVWGNKKYRRKFCEYFFHKI